MMIFLKKFAILPLMVSFLLAGMMNAFAYPGNSRAVDDRQQEWTQTSQARRDGEEREQRDAERQGSREGRQYADGQNPQGRLPSNSGTEEGRRGKMSPEERRALRRQIDEVGRDLYPPRR